MLRPSNAMLSRTTPMRYALRSAEGAAREDPFRPHRAQCRLGAARTRAGRRPRRDGVGRLPGLLGDGLERGGEVLADGVQVLAQGVAHDLARVVVAGVEVGQVEVGQLRTDLLGDLLLGVVQEHPETAHGLGQLAGVLGQALRPDDDDHHQDDDEEFGTRDA